MDKLPRFSTPHGPCQIDDQILKATQKRFQCKMLSFERLKEGHSKGIRTLCTNGRVRSSLEYLKDQNPRGVAREFAHDSFPGPKAPRNILFANRIARDGNNDQLESCFVEEPTFNSQTATGNSLQTTLEWHKRFFNNRPLRRCLDTREDEDMTDKLYEMLLEESRRTIGEGLTSQLDNTNDDTDSLYEMLLRETAQDVKHSLQESSRRDMNVRAWWDIVRAELRDEDELA